VNKGSATADTDYTMVLNLAKTLNDANPNNFNGQQPNPFWGTFTGRTVISGNLSSSNPAKQSSTNGYDNDRYRLDINNLGSQSPNILRLGLNNLAPNATAKVVVYDGNNQPVKEQLFYPGQNSPLEVSGLAEGPYFVGVEQVQGDTPYNLAVHLDQAGENWSSARNLGDLTGLRKEYQDFVSATRDAYDYYKFTIKDSRLLQLAPRLFDSDNQADVKVELYDANQQLVTFTENNQIYNADLAAGDYYVKVVPGSGNDTNYRLVVNLKQPGSKTNRLAQLVSNKTLTIDEIIEYRQLVAELPQSERASWYRKLQFIVPYFSQRDNASTEQGHRIYASMCNVTTLASCLTVLGVRNPQPEQQFEDYLNTQIQDRTNWWELKYLAQKYVPTSDVNSIVRFLPGDYSDFHQQVKQWEEAFKVGKSVMVSVLITSSSLAQGGHIVRVLGVDWEKDGGGIYVDDPWGKASLSPNGMNGAYYENQWNDKNLGTANTQQGENEKGIGKQNFWTWEMCAQFFGNSSGQSKTWGPNRYMILG
jgi:hypothetical protein